MNLVFNLKQRNYSDCQYCQGSQYITQAID